MANLGSPVNAVRVFLLTAVGMPAAGALTIGTVVYVGYQLATGEPFSTGDLFGAAIFGLLPLLVVGIAFRAAARVRKSAGEDETFPWLARLAPLLVLVGAGGGAWFSYQICRDHQRDLRMSAEMLCTQLLGAVSTDERVVRCTPLAFDCEKEQRRKPEDLQSARFHPDFPKRPEVMCTAAKMAAQPTTPQRPQDSGP